MSANVRSRQLREQPEPERYFAIEQDACTQVAVVVRSTVEPESLATSLRHAVAEVDRSVPVSEVKTMEHIVSESVTQPRFNLFLLALFSGIALATFFAVVALLLGAAAVLGHVFSVFVSFRGGKGVATAAGIVLGLAPLAFLAARQADSLLWGVDSRDPFTYIAAAAVLGVIGFARKSPRWRRC